MFTVVAIVAIVAVALVASLIVAVVGARRRRLVVNVASSSPLR